MINLTILIVSFISLFLGIFWINVLYLDRPKKKLFHELPTVSILIPAHNEEKDIAETVEALVNLDYPQEKLEIIVVNDDSTDNTGKVVESLINKYDNVTLINRKKPSSELKVKAPALNEGLKHARGELVACVDADTIVEKSSLKSIVHYFTDEKVGAAISIIKLKEERSFWEKLQRIEYIFTSLMRELMAKMNILHITPGALSIYRTAVLKRLGGFDEDNVTEDLEIALRLYSHHYRIKMDHNSIVYTRVPSTFKEFWDQRVRWFRGFIHNHLKYKKMFMNKEYGLMGFFQFPINILTFVTMILLFFLLGYKVVSNIYQLSVLFSVVKLNILDYLKLPTFDSMVFSIDIKLTMAIFITLVLSLYLYHLAHRAEGEKWKFPVQTIIYFTFYPMIRSLQWTIAMIQEFGRAKKKW